MFGLWEVGGKTVKRSDRQTDRQTNIQTFQLIESIGPEGRCFEKCYRIFRIEGDLSPLGGVNYPWVTFTVEMLDVTLHFLRGLQHSTGTTFHSKAKVGGLMCSAL